MPITGKNPILIVFSNVYNVIIAVSISVAFGLLLNVLDQLLFFWPTLIFYLPREKVVSFTISILTSAVLGVVVPMNIYAIRKSRKLDTSFLPGTSFAIASCTCAGCSTVGLSLLPTLGSIGAVGIAFFAQYQDLLRVASLLILFWSLFSVYRQIERKWLGR